MAILRKLAEDNPTVTEFRADLASSYGAIGSSDRNAGRLAEAVEDFDREAAILEELSKDNASVPDYRNGLANSLTNTIEILIALGRIAEARARSERAVTLREALVRDVPGVPRYRYELAESYLRAAQAREAGGDLAGSLADARRAVALFRSVPRLIGKYLFFHGCTHALIAGLARKPRAGISAEDREADAVQAIALLRQAAAVDSLDPSAFRGETVLDPLRGRADFQLLMMDLAFPVDPFFFNR